MGFCNFKDQLEISLTTILTIPSTLSLILHFLFTSQIYDCSAWLYFPPIILFIVACVGLFVSIQEKDEGVQACTCLLFFIYFVSGKISLISELLAFIISFKDYS